MKPKKVPLIELLPCLISQENGAFMNNEKQGERNKRKGFISVYVPYVDHFKAMKFCKIIFLHVCFRVCESFTQTCFYEISFNCFQYFSFLFYPV